MKIDSHAHVVLPVEDHLALMQEGGIDATVLFSTTVHPENARDMNEFTQEMKRLHSIIAGKGGGLEAKSRSIEEQAKVIETYKDKFFGFGTVPMEMDYRETGDWIEKYVVANRFKGLGEFVPARGTVSQLEPVFQVSRDVGCLPLWVHGFWPMDANDMKELFRLSEGYPDVPVIVGHLGGIHWMEVIDAAKANPNLYVDLSAAYTSIALKMTMQEVPEKSLFSSDLPYGDPVLAKMAIERLCPDKGKQGLVLGENMAKLLGI